MKIFSRYSQIIKFYFFLKNNLIITNKQKKYKSIILIEYFNYKPSIIPFYYFAKNLQKINNSELKLYIPKVINFKTKILILLDKYFFLSFYKIFNLFGVKEIVIPNSQNHYSNFNLIFNNIKSKNDVLKIKLNNILIGDLIYDDYLRSLDKVTVDFKSDEFKKFLNKSINLFYFWDNYFKKNKVSSIIFSHATYLIGLAPRIAINHNIQAYKVGPANAYKLTKKFPYTFDDRKNYKKVFKSFSKEIKNRYINYSKENILTQFLGKKPTEKYIKHIINIKKKDVKILISSHDFTDAVHIYGNFIFNDFHEWISYLANFSHQTNYKWFIKIHPSDYDRNIIKIKYYENIFNNLVILPKNFSNKKVLALGLSAVLTVYGTVGREYPIFNIPVINASKNNPHSQYDFNFHVRTLPEYKNILNNIQSLRINPYKCRKEIMKYYSSKYSNYNIIDDFRSAILKVKYKKNGINFKKEIENNVFDNWIKNYTTEKNKLLNEDISSFIKSKHTRMIADNTLSSSKLINIKI
jgi:hypothetical protein